MYSEFTEVILDAAKVKSDFSDAVYHVVIPGGIGRVAFCIL